MKKRIKISIWACLLLVLPGYAQKQANNWYFGTNAGLTWNTIRTVTATGVYGVAGQIQLHDLPVDAPGSSIHTTEGCFSLSDENGNLLFYSSGIVIWNRNHAVMENGGGLTGHTSSAQSGIIITYPGSKTKYIAVSIGQYGQSSNLPTRNGQLTYSVIDMTLDNGLGAVVEKNVPLINFSGTVGESVTSIRHANGRDFWIVAPARGLNSYLNAWLVTAEGVVTDTPVISPFAPGTGSTVTHNASGYIKFSPDGKSFAWATNYSNQLHVGRFDSKTGKMSEPRTMTGASLYGLEFSNSGKYLYARPAELSNILRAYDFESLLANGPNASNTISIPNLSYGAIQMGPDGRIYMVNPGTRNMYIIENPEEMNNLKIYRLSNFMTGTGLLGLPSFSASWFAIDKFKSTICLDEEAVYTISSSTGQVMIDFDEGEGKQLMNVPENGEIRHRFKKPGGYMVTVELYGAANMEPQTAYTTVYSCFMPVNHNTINMK